MSNLKYTRIDPAVIGAECAGDGDSATGALRERLQALEQRLHEEGGEERGRAALLLDIGQLQLELQQDGEAWRNGEEAFQIYRALEDWEGAAAACQIMFLADQPDSLPALGHAVWFSVTYPIDPDLTVAVLQHVVEETPDDSDGGAVAAATACYIADIRAAGKERERLLFFTNQLLGQVARRHGNVEEQASFEAWISRLELDDPEKFIPRLGRVVEILTQNQWWIDRDALRAKLPVD